MLSAIKRTIRAALVRGGNAVAEVDVPESLTMIDDPKACAPDGCGCFRILTVEHGDARVLWTQSEPGQVRDARRMFNRLVERGLVPYRTGTSRVMPEFDEKATDVVFVPVSLVAGG